MYVYISNSYAFCLCTYKYIYLFRVCTYATSVTTSTAKLRKCIRRPFRFLPTAGRKKKSAPLRLPVVPEKNMCQFMQGSLNYQYFLKWNQIEILQMYGKLWVISLIIVHCFGLVSCNDPCYIIQHICCFPRFPGPKLWSPTPVNLRLRNSYLDGCPVGSAGKRLGSVGYNPNIHHL